MFSSLWGFLWIFGVLDKFLFHSLMIGFLKLYHLVFILFFLVMTLRHFSSYRCPIRLWEVEKVWKFLLPFNLVLLFFLLIHDLIGLGFSSQRDVVTLICSFIFHLLNYIPIVAIWWDWFAGDEKSSTSKHLEELDDPQKSSEDGAKVITRQEYVSRLHELKDEINRAWHSEDRVKSLKLSIKVNFTLI